QAGTSKSQSIMQRNAAEDALRQLERHRGIFVASYPAMLREIFVNGGPTTTKGKSNALSDLSIDELELMDYADVQNSVELARARQIAIHASEDVLAELNTYVSAVQGLARVLPDHNPLRPDSYIQALQNVLAQSQAPEQMRQAWLHPMSDALGAELGGIYRRMIDVLHQQGVAPVGYTAALPASTGSNYLGEAGDWRGGISQESSAGQGAMPPAAALALQAEKPALNIEWLRQLLAGTPAGGVGGPTMPIQPAPAAQMPVAASAPEAGPAVPDPLADSRMLELVLERLVRHGYKTPEAASATAGEEVVKMMVENVIHDTRFLLPVRKAVQELEPALLQLVHKDTDFFRDKNHPARRLLEEMTERSLAFDAVGAPGFSKFMRVTHESVKRLAKTSISSMQPFQTMLQLLERAWDNQDVPRAMQPSDKNAPSQAPQANPEQLKAKQQELLAQDLAADIESWSGADGVPQEIMAFVVGPWVQVIAKARQTKKDAAATDPGGYYRLVPALFWSVQPKYAGKNLPRLSKLIPRLLAKLREGLKTIDYPAEQAGAFFEQLVGLHQLAYQVVPPQAVPTEEVPAAAASPAAVAPVQPVDTALPAPAEAVVPGAGVPPASYEQATPSQESEPVAGVAEMTDDGVIADSAPVGQADTAIPAPAPELSAASSLPLELGTWVELITHGRTVHTQLTWASPHGTLFLFTGADGSTQSMTRRVRDKLAAEGNLRVVMDDDAQG
ncbi:MAG TPA: DUF1631 family protein, partial [Burkholderiaceae bacterium]